MKTEDKPGPMTQAFMDGWNAKNRMEAGKITPEEFRQIVRRVVEPWSRNAEEKPVLLIACKTCGEADCDGRHF